MFYVNVGNDFWIVCEEVFGLIGVIICFKDEVEVIRIVNDILFGLVGVVWIENVCWVYWMILCI